MGRAARGGGGHCPDPALLRSQPLASAPTGRGCGQSPKLPPARQSPALLPRPQRGQGSFVSRLLLPAPELPALGCAIVPRADLANDYPSPEGSPRPCRAPRVGRDARGVTPRTWYPILLSHLSSQPRSPQPGFPARRGLVVSPSPPQSKQQKRSCLPATTPPRDAANKQKSNLSSQMLQEQGEGRRYPPNPPPSFISPRGDAGRQSPPCHPPPPPQSAPAPGGPRPSQHPPPLQLAQTLPTGPSLSWGKGNSFPRALLLRKPGLRPYRA